MSSWMIALAKSGGFFTRRLSMSTLGDTALHNTNFRSMSGAISVQPVSESRYREVLDHVTPIFLRDEPLSQCFPSCTTGRRERDFREYAETQLRSGLCVMALDGSAIVGACLNRSLTRNQVMEDSPDGPAEDPLIGSVVSMLLTVHRQLDLFKTLEVDTLFELGLVSVESTHLGRGLAVRMLRESLELAARKGFRAAKADCTGPASARACERAGMVPVHRLPYDEYKVDNKVVFRNTATRGPALTVMAARLQDSDPYVRVVQLRSKV